jgi:hypothetical protein
MAAKSRDGPGRADRRAERPMGLAICLIMIFSKSRHRLAATAL